MRSVALTARRALPNRLSAGALAITLLVALLACACGAVVAWQEPATPPRHQGAHRALSTSIAPVPRALPDGAQVTGVIAAIDQETGALRIAVGAESYVYRVDYRTAFPDPCLTRPHLRAGQLIRLVLPWYLSGTVAVEAIAPLRACGMPRSGAIVSHTNDSPPARASAN